MHCFIFQLTVGTQIYFLNRIKYLLFSGKFGSRRERKNNISVVLNIINSCHEFGMQIGFSSFIGTLSKSHAAPSKQFYLYEANYRLCSKYEV